MKNLYVASEPKHFIFDRTYIVISITNVTDCAQTEMFGICFRDKTRHCLKLLINSHTQSRSNKLNKMYIILFCYSSSKIQHLFCFLIGFKIKSVLKMPHEIYVGTTYNRNHFKTFGFGSIFFFVKLFKVNLFKTHSIIEIYVLKMTYNSPFTIFLLDFSLFINSKS